MVSAIEPQKKKKDRFNIYIDGEYAVSLGAETLVIHGIQAGETIGEAKLKSAVFDDHSKYAFDSAVSMLAMKMRTRLELHTKLLGKGIDEAAVSAALDKLAGYGYVDDDAYAKAYVENAVASANYGRKVIAFRLKSLGIDSEIAKAALSLYTPEIEHNIAEQNYKALRARYRNDPKTRHKIFSALARHGFDYDIIHSLISEDEET